MQPKMLEFQAGNGDRVAIIAVNREALARRDKNIALSKPLALVRIIPAPLLCGKVLSERIMGDIATERIKLADDDFA